MRWARRWRDEELLVRVGCLQVLILRFNLGIRAEVDAHATIHDGLAVECFPYQGRVLDRVEGCDDAAHGFERRPGVYGDMLVYYVSDRLEVIWLKDREVVEVLVVRVSSDIPIRQHVWTYCDEKRICRW